MGQSLQPQRSESEERVAWPDPVAAHGGQNAGRPDATAAARRRRFEVNAISLAA